MTTQKIQQRSADGQRIESAIADGVPHLTYHDQRTTTTFCWTGDPEHGIEVSAGYGEPVYDLVPVPAFLAQPYGTTKLLEKFAYVCNLYTVGNQPTH